MEGSARLAVEALNLNINAVVPQHSAGQKRKLREENTELKQKIKKQEQIIKTQEQTLTDQQQQIQQHAEQTHDKDEQIKKLQIQLEQNKEKTKDNNNNNKNKNHNSSKKTNKKKNNDNSTRNKHDTKSEGVYRHLRPDYQPRSDGSDICKHHLLDRCTSGGINAECRFGLHYVANSVQMPVSLTKGSRNKGRTVEERERHDTEYKKQLDEYKRTGKWPKSQSDTE